MRNTNNKPSTLISIHKKLCRKLLLLWTIPLLVSSVPSPAFAEADQTPVETIESTAELPESTPAPAEEPAPTPEPESEAPSTDSTEEPAPEEPASDPAPAESSEAELPDSTSSDAESGTSDPESTDSPAKGADLSPESGTELPDGTAESESGAKTDEEKAEEEPKEEPKEEEAKTAETSSITEHSDLRYNGTYRPKLKRTIQKISAYDKWYKSLSDAQKLLLGKRQVEKVPAVSLKASSLNIREGKGTDHKVVGVLSKGDVCYLLADTNSDWVYAESGDVRGFVKKSWLTTGKDAENYVAEKGGDASYAEEKVSPENNGAFHYTDTTVCTFRMATSTGESVTVDGDMSEREALIDYSMQFLGRPYVWGGNSLWNGCDCSGFAKGIYAEFGYTLPRYSGDQARAGKQIPVSDAEPGDLLFYAENGRVYHVLIYIGDGEAINAQSSDTGIVISKVNYAKACWAVSMLSGDSGVTIDGYTTTQASDLAEVAEKAAEGDSASQQAIINTFAVAADKESNDYGYPKSVLIAEAILESSWGAFEDAGENGPKAGDNNLFAMSETTRKSGWESSWDGDVATRTIKIKAPEPDVQTEEDVISPDASAEDVVHASDETVQSEDDLRDDMMWRNRAKAMAEAERRAAEEKAADVNTGDSEDEPDEKTITKEVKIRVYDDIEGSLYDRAAYMTGSYDSSDEIGKWLDAVAEEHEDDPDYRSDMEQLIKEYGLSAYDAK